MGNPREFIQAEKQEQEIAEGCKRLIKNCITCWNYLYLSQKLSETDDLDGREALLQAVANGSISPMTSYRIQWESSPQNWQLELRRLLGVADNHNPFAHNRLGKSPCRFSYLCWNLTLEVYSAEAFPLYHEQTEKQLKECERLLTQAKLQAP